MCVIQILGLLDYYLEYIIQHYLSVSLATYDNDYIIDEVDRLMQILGLLGYLLLPQRGYF